MELDDLKQAWQQQTPEDIDVRNNKNIIDMIQNKSYGPLAIIKNKVLRLLYMFPLLVIMLISLEVDSHKTLDSFTEIAIAYVAVLFIVSMSTYGYFLIIINRLQKDNNPIKSNIEKNLNDIKKGYRVQYIISQFIVFAFIVALEILMSLHKIPRYERWYSVSIYLRILTYLGFFILFYFSNRWNYYRYFGKHIDYMKDMLRKME